MITHDPNPVPTAKDFAKMANQGIHRVPVGHEFQQQIVLLIDERRDGRNRCQFRRTVIIAMECNTYKPCRDHDDVALDRPLRNLRGNQINI